jgi:hypothetical protein
MSDILDIMQRYPCEGECKFKQGYSTATLVAYPVIYDKTGVNTNPDRNTKRTDYTCTTCQKQFNVVSQYGSETAIILKSA